MCGRMCVYGCQWVACGGGGGEERKAMTRRAHGRKRTAGALPPLQRFCPSPSSRNGHLYTSCCRVSFSSGCGLVTVRSNTPLRLEAADATDVFDDMFPALLEEERERLRPVPG